MRTLALASVISLSAVHFGCSSTNTPAGSASAGAGNTPGLTAGSGGSAGSIASGGSPSGSGGSVAGSANTAGSGGAVGNAAGSAGTSAAAGSAGAGSAGSPSTHDGSLGNGDYTGMGMSSERYYTASDITRNGQKYVLITNGWGPGFQSHTISWSGTSFTVDKMEGKAGANGEPSSYPAVFCGVYSVRNQTGDCGLPKAVSAMTSLRTGWRWAPNGNEEGKYNAAYDIWVGNETGFTGYLMVWLRDPPMFQPAGSKDEKNQGVTVANVPGTWDIWKGTVNSRPIVNWVRREGSDSHEIEFDVLDFVRDAEMRGLSIPNSTHIRAVAAGFEIWEGSIAGLQSLDFYVKVN